MTAMANTHDPNVLYRIATHSKDERLCLEAAHRLNDPTLLIRLARIASDVDIRFEAALLVCDQATLAAIALDAWQIEQGKMAVIHIDNALLLRRLARSANQEPIRLAAALKLKDPGLLKQIALSANDISLCWQVALHLDDPHLLAKVACTKQSNTRSADLCNKAHHAFLDHLDRCRHKSDHTALSTIIQGVPHTPFKIDAFLRLPPDKIPPELMTHLSQQDFQSTSNGKIQRMLLKIQQSGWRVRQSDHPVACRQCNGDGQISLRSMAAESSHMAHDRSTCTACDGLGQQLINVVTCTHDMHPEVTFHIPVNERDLPQWTSQAQHQYPANPT